MSVGSSTLEEHIRAMRDALHTAERRLADTQLLARIGSWELDIKANALWWSDATYRLFELDPARFGASYEAFLALVHPEDREMVDRSYTESVAKRTPYEITHRLLMPDGRIKYVREVARTVYDDSGAAARSFGSVLDVTDAVESENRLTAAERRFRALIEHAADIIAVLASDRRITFLNEAFERLLGRPAKTWCERDITDLVCRDDLSAAIDIFSRAAAEPDVVIPWQLRMQHADGTLRWFEGTATNRVGDPAVGGIVINCRDATARLRAQEDLRKSEEHLRQVIEVARVGIFDHDHRTETIYWSPRQREIYQYDPDAPVSLEVFSSFVHPDDRNWVWETVQRAHDPRGDGTWSVEHRIVRSDGSVRWLISRAGTAFEGEGAGRHPVRTVGAVIDVTDVHNVYDQMRIKDKAIDTALVPIAISDATGPIVYVNPAFVRTWGFESEREILGRLPTEFADPVATADVLRLLAEQGSAQGEVVAYRKDGSKFDIILSASSVRDAQGRVTHFMASFLDISESKRLQAQLLQAQKMESVGRLAGGIAHDFNNLLTVIKGNADLALSELKSADPMYDIFRQVSAAADSAASLTRQLLAFSRKQIISPQVLDLNEVIHGVERMLGRLLREDIELRTFLSPSAPRARFDRAQLEQVLVNLAVNARDAMPEGGKLTIETDTVTLDEAYARAHPGASPGEYACLAVSDTGVGMDATVQSHLFEPFFTTKGLGRGTGLGLPMVFGAVAQNGGRIEVYSEVGHGATFKVYLPSVREAVRAAVPAKSRARSGGNELILLIEDDDAVRRIATSVLTRHGYRVRAFSTGSEALRALDAPDARVDLLLTDVVMPDLKGPEIAERVIARWPQVRVLFTSGYTENVIVHHGVLKPGVEFLAKPYTVDSLTERVRDVLDSRH